MFYRAVKYSSSFQEGSVPKSWRLYRLGTLAKGLAWIVLLTLSGLTGFAANTNRVSLAWDPSPDDFVEGYRLHYGYESGTNYIFALDTTNLTASVSNLASGVTYFFMVTAYVTNYDGTLLESDPSNEISYQPPIANSPPQLSSINDLFTHQNIPTDPVPFTVTDSDTPASNLVVFANSSNTNLLPNAGILLSGTGSNRFLVLNPSLDQTGNTTVALFATDGSATSSVSFVLTVDPRLTTNDSPVAGALSLNRVLKNGVKIKVSNLLTNASDVNGDSLSLLSIGACTNGGTAQINQGWVTYSSGSTNTDAFSYTVVDGHGGAASGWVVINPPPTTVASLSLLQLNATNTTSMIRFDVIPALTYGVQETTNMVTPDWQLIGANMANGMGVLSFVIVPNKVKESGLVGGATSSGDTYFRSSYP